MDENPKVKAKFTSIRELRSDLAASQAEVERLRDYLGWIRTWTCNDGRGYKDPEALLEKIDDYVNKALESEDSDG